MALFPAAIERQSAAAINPRRLRHKITAGGARALAFGAASA
ncbi:hypothetical protein U713_13795 [Rhodobacter capsulatus YW2]|nr:hypothetical protein U713_13795 [Rhodobacter capsulatus YW2]